MRESWEVMYMVSQFNKTPLAKVEEGGRVHYPLFDDELQQDICNFASPQSHKAQWNNNFRHLGLKKGSLLVDIHLTSVGAHIMAPKEWGCVSHLNL